MSDEQKYGQEFRMYKPRKDGKGVASQLDLNTKSSAVFLEMAKQLETDQQDNAAFDWKNKICFKLGVVDIGEILTVLDDKQNGVGPLHPETGKHRGLYHQSKDGNAVLYFTRGKETGFFMKLSIRRGDDKRELQHMITNGESKVLSTLLKCAIVAFYRWR